MAYILRLRNTKNGSVSVDENYVNMNFSHSFDINVGVVQDIPFPFGTPHIKCIHSKQGTALTHAFDPYVNVNIQYQKWSVSHNPCKAYIFTMQEPPEAEYGINFRNPETGKITFSSAMKPLRVVDAAFGWSEMWTGGGALYDKQLDPSRDYAVALGNVPVRLDASGRYSNVHGMHIQTNNGRVTVQPAIMGDKNTGGVRGQVYTPTYNFLIVDITDY